MSEALKVKKQIPRRSCSRSPAPSKASATVVDKFEEETVDGSEIPNNHRLDGAKTL